MGSQTGLEITIGASQKDLVKDLDAAKRAVDGWAKDFQTAAQRAGTGLGGLGDAMRNFAREQRGQDKVAVG